MYLASFRGYVLFTALVETAYFVTWPFWSFKDANCGTLFDRAAALRHNIEQRHLLVGYAVRWMAILIALLAMLDVAEYLMTLSETFKGLWLGLTVGVGISVAGAMVMLFEIVVVYAFLARAETVACGAEVGRYR